MSAVSLRAAVPQAFRGGYYVDTSLNGNGCLYATTAHDTSYWDYSTGFRCCADLQ
jgi:sulfatase modifying factor 1